MKIWPKVCHTFLTYASFEEIELSLSYPPSRKQKVSPEHVAYITRAVRDVWREISTSAERAQHMQIYYTSSARTYQGRGLLLSPLYLLRYLGQTVTSGNPIRWGRVLRALGCPRTVLNYRGQMRNLTLYYVSEEQIQEWTRRGLCSTKKLDTHLPLG